MNINLSLFDFVTGEKLTTVSDEIVVFESFSSQFIYGHCFVETSNEIAQSLTVPFYLSIEMISGADENDGSTVLENVFKKQFVVYSILDQFVSPQGTKTQKLLFCSPEMLVCTSKNICKAWPLETTTFPLIIKDIVNTHLKSNLQQPFNYDDTEENTSFIATNEPIIDIINRIRQLTCDSDGYPFVFFENKKGLNFKSIKNLLNTTSPIPNLVLSNTLESAENLPTFQFVHLLKIDRCFDLYSAINQSALSGTLHVVDIYNQPDSWELARESFVVDEEQFKNVDSFLPVTTSSIQPFINTNNNNQNENFGTNLFWPISNFTYMDYLKDKLFQKNAAQYYLSSTCCIEVIQTRSLGIFELGSCVNVMFDFVVEPTDGDGVGVSDQSLYNGKFLITKIVHTISVRDPPILYTQSLQLCKFGVAEDLQELVNDVTEES